MCMTEESIFNLKKYNKNKQQQQNPSHHAGWDIFLKSGKTCLRVLSWSFLFCSLFVFLAWLCIFDCLFINWSPCSQPRRINYETHNHLEPHCSTAHITIFLCMVSCTGIVFQLDSKLLSQAILLDLVMSLVFWNKFCDTSFSNLTFIIFPIPYFTRKDKNIDWSLTIWCYFHSFAKMMAAY